MRKKLLFFILILFLTSTSLSALTASFPTNRSDAPFGLEWGMSIAEAYKKCISTDIEYGSNLSYVYAIPPEPLYCFREYTLTFGDMGLSGIYAEGYESGRAEDYGDGSFWDPLYIAREFASEEVFPYSALIKRFGKPDSIEDTLDTDEMFLATWENDYIDITFMIWILDDNDSWFFDKKIEISVDYYLSTKGEDKIGKTQAGLLY